MGILRRNFLRNLVYLSVLLVSVVALAQVPLVNLPLVPDAKTPGGGSFTLTVNGTGFVSGSVVNWNNTPRATTFVSASQLKAAIPAADIATKGTASVTVVNPAPGGGTSKPVFFTVAAGRGGTVSFTLSSSLVTGRPWIGASALAVGDWNGDGKLDLAVVSGGYTISILLGDGSGNFSIASSATVDGAPISLAVGDFNDDGKSDLAVASELGTVDILLGDGTGNFTFASSTRAGSMPFEVAAADFNGDGELDVAVANYGNSGTVSILLGDGTGKVTLASSPFVGYHPTSITAGDFNGDGKLDLAVGNCPDVSTISILLGDGTGNFSLTSSPEAGSKPNSIAAGDFNKDGMLDLAVADTGMFNAASILLGDGTGTFTLASPVGTSAGYSVAAGDFNGDGALDLAVASLNNTVSIALGDGKGSFTAAASPATGVGPISVVAGDFNGDGWLDLAVANQGDQSVSILLNNGPQHPTTTTFVSTPNPSTYGQTVTLTASVNSLRGTPTGTVAFLDGSVAVGNATLAGGSAAISLSSIAAGSHSLTAAYQGGPGYAPSTSNPVNQDVNTSTSSTLLESSVNPVPLKEYVTYTASVTSQYGGPVGGTVTFEDGGSAIATVAVSAGRAVYVTKYTATGSHAITAAYSGDQSNTASTSTILSEQVIVGVTSKTVLVTSSSPTYVGQSVIFTATVTPKTGIIPNGELVTFYDGTAELASVATAGGTAPYTTSFVSAKTHTIKAYYPGDATLQPSAGTVNQVVLKLPTTTTLVSSLNPSPYWQAVTFTATVTPSGPFAITGWVRFWDGAVLMGTTKVNGGMATLTKKGLGVGTHAVTAKYMGDSNNANSTSPVVSQIVQ